MQAGNDVGYRVMFRQDEDSATEGSSGDENEDNAGRPAKCFAFGAVDRHGEKVPCKVYAGDQFPPSSDCL